MNDQIKNVIESGQVYTEKHFFNLLESMDPVDLQKPEVQKFIEIYEDEMACERENQMKN